MRSPKAIAEGNGSPSRWANGETELSGRACRAPRKVTGCTEMSTDHAATARRLYELINAGDVGGFSDHLAADFVEHEVTPGLEPTKEGVKQFFQMQIAAFPDLRMIVEDAFGSGSKVVTRVRYTGTHKGEFMGMPATGKKFNVQLIDVFNFGDDGLVREHWGVLDALAMMQQLGAVPAGSPA
jgi:steroid delta-isomerase-like uncharacterized protein